MVRHLLPFVALGLAGIGIGASADSHFLPTDDGGRIRRPLSSPPHEVGLNGALRWKKDSEGFESLALFLPSGKSIPLAAGRVVQETLTVLASQNRQVELSGYFRKRGGEAELFIKEVESSTGTHFNGYYNVLVKDSLSSAEAAQIFKTLSRLPGARIVSASSLGSEKDPLHAIAVQTDLSERELLRRLKADPGTAPLVRAVEKTGEYSPAESATVSSAPREWRERNGSVSHPE